MPPSASERRQHGQRIRGLTQFIEYLGKKEADLTMVRRRPTPLFHYTSLDGLKGVIDSHDLWLTHARYSNDEREITLGLDIAREAITQARAAAKKHYRDYLDQLLSLLNPGASGDVYICCFCEQDDRLSQWRAYGGDGNGVTIEIEPMAFVQYTGVQPTGVLSLWKVTCEQAHHLSIMREALDWTYHRYGARTTVVTTSMQPLSLCSRRRSNNY